MNSAERVGGKVVIVEDNKEMASLLEVWLEDDYAVEIAHDCATAYELIDGSVDVVLLDRQLPDGSGDEVLEHIRDVGYDCRVAMVSAVDPGLDIIQMGFDDYLCKPIEKQELLDIVRRLLMQSEYEEEVQRLYTLVRKKVLLEENHTDTKLECSDEYEALEAEIEALNEDLTEKAVSFSESQFHAEMQRL